MFITKKKMPRRTFLHGAGVTLALPLLEAMVPAGTALAQTPANPKPRFVGVFYPHGMAPGYWEPEREGPLPEKLPFITETLEEVKDQTVVITGLWSKSAEPPEGTTGSDHWVAAAFLTAIKPRKTAGSDASVGNPTIDQVIAQKIGQDNLLPSLQLAVEDPNSSSSNCGEGYSCSYTNSISWNTPTTPLPMELNPQVVFEGLFGSGATPEVRAARMKESRSILDSVMDKLQSLKKNLGAPDQRTINQYTEEVREIERRIQLAAKASTEGDGTLLDHSLILHGTNMGNSTVHEHYDVPHFLVGGAGGKLKGGRHIRFDSRTVTTGNLLLSILDLYGIHQERQGDSTG